MEKISLFFGKIVAKNCYWERLKINQKGSGIFKKKFAKILTPKC